MGFSPCVWFADNVHFQQAAQISKALVDAEVDFQAMVSHKNLRSRQYVQTKRAHTQIRRKKDADVQAGA